VAALRARDGFGHRVTREEWRVAGKRGNPLSNTAATEGVAAAVERDRVDEEASAHAALELLDEAEDGGVRGLLVGVFLGLWILGHARHLWRMGR
jgi:hypothetical protein